MIEREKLIAMVQGAQNGDEKAQSRLFETFQGDIYYFILNKVDNDRELAEDLTQDTFLEILETIDKLKEPAAFVTWSKQIALHKCTAYFRKRRELLVDENEDGFSVFDTIEEENIEFIPDAALDHEDLRQTIIKMISDLPEEQKSAIVLRYFNEISVREISEIQGVTEGTVKSRLNYGRKSIRQAVEEYEKKNGVRLHCFGVVPLLLWFFKDYRIKNGMRITSNTFMQVFKIGGEFIGDTAVTGLPVSPGAAAVVGPVPVPTTPAPVSTAVLVTKIVAAITSVTVLVGGVAAAISSVRNREEAVISITYEEPETTYNEPETTCGETEPVYQEPETKPLKLCEHERTRTVYYEEDPRFKDEICEKCDTVVYEHIPDEYQIYNMEFTTFGNTCNHQWESQKVYEDDVPVSELWNCTVCGELIEIKFDKCEHQLELKHHPFIYRNGVSYMRESIQCFVCPYVRFVRNYEYTCDHKWNIKTDVMITECEGVTTQKSNEQSRECENCGALDLFCRYRETCNHNWIGKQEFYYYDTELVCDKCGSTNQISTSFEMLPCNHTWIENPVYVANTLRNIEKTCSKCGESEVVCVHEWIDLFPHMEGIVFDVGVTCRYCGYHDMSL